MSSLRNVLGNKAAILARPPGYVLDLGADGTDVQAAERLLRLRLLGLHSGPDIIIPAAASLAGIPPGQAGALLAELAQAHMLTEHTPGRYSCHDLLRAFGAELAHSLDAGNERQAAMHRMLDHYLYAAAG